jgi:SAM-dependent methyltransferase
MSLADAVSRRSRRRKLNLFLETMRPSPETSVLDLGVDDVGFGDVGAPDHGGCGTLNFFEEHYPWPERITALGQHEGTRFRQRYPGVTYVQGNALELPFEDGAFDAAVSVFGVIFADLDAAAGELARVVRPGGRLFLVTLVSGGTRRADLSIRAGQLTGIIPTAPPDRETLLRWLREAGWQDIEPLGGKGLVGYDATRRA